MFFRTHIKQVWQPQRKTVTWKKIGYFVTWFFRSHFFPFLGVKVTHILHGNNRDARLYHKVIKCWRLTVFWCQLLRRKNENWAAFLCFQSVRDFHFSNFVTRVFIWICFRITFTWKLKSVGHSFSDAVTKFFDRFSASR